MSIPSFGELPRSAHLGLRCAWRVFDTDGIGDRLGTLNFLDPGAVKAGLAAARTGERIALSLPLTEPAPGLFWRTPPAHQVQRIDRNILDDQLDGLYLQGSTHWDGFLHVSAREDGFYGGRSEAGPALGIDGWSTGIVGRGVLADVAAYLDSTGTPMPLDQDFEITVEMLRATLRHQGTELSPGDVLCLRTGWTEFYCGLAEPERAQIGRRGHFPGLRADEPMAAFLWDNRVAALAADNPAVEVTPGNRETGSLHRRSLVMTGLPFGELFDFARLGRRCGSNGRWEFLFVSVPLNLPGGVGSPANAIAVI